MSTLLRFSIKSKVNCAHLWRIIEYLDVSVNVGHTSGWGYRRWIWSACVALQAFLDGATSDFTSKEGQIHAHEGTSLR